MATTTSLIGPDLTATYRDLGESALNLRAAIDTLRVYGWECNAAELGEALTTVEMAMSGLESYATGVGVEL